ncbi:MAG: hypothetical protein Q8P05_05610 [Candidatus Diapherotrites archaeon]|nr:hypothetical protein [Candidatus Diapherotrites archaeon]MDZ4256470.1 hypothetical protein [archaeon]
MPKTLMGKGKGHFIAHLLRGALVIGIILSFIQGKGDHALFLILGLAGSGIIYYVTSSWIQGIGEWMDVLFALLVVFDTLLGVGLGFYNNIPGWDVATHYTTSLFLGVGALLLLERAYPAMLFQTKKELVVMAMVLFSLGIGGLWEISEFWADYFFNTSSQISLTNTMQDLMVDGIAGGVVGILWVGQRRE